MPVPKIILFFCILFSEGLNAQAPEYCIAGRFSEFQLFNYWQIRKDTGVVFAYSYNPFTHVVDTLKMDIYYPDLMTDVTIRHKPFILLAHGGSFLSGGRGAQDLLCEEYAKRGFVSASVDYRVGWDCPYFYTYQFCNLCAGDTDKLKVSTYMAVQDIRAALRYVGINAATWGADPDWFFVGGASAGSIASYHAALWTQAQANSFAPTAMSTVGLLDTAGNTLAVNYSIRGITDNCGAIAEDSNLVAQLTIPLISFTDEFDCFIPSNTGHIFMCNCNLFYKLYGAGFIHSRMEAAGSCSELNILYNSPGHCNFPALTIVQRSSCFFKRVMCNVCESDTNSNPGYIKSCNELGSGVEFLASHLSISVFPSPANDLITINFSEHTRHAGSFKCINYLGQEVFTQSYPYMTQRIEISTADMSSGIYFLIFEDEKKISPMKVMVIHQ